MMNFEIIPMQIDHIDGVMEVENASFTIPWSKDSFILELTTNKFSRYVVAMQQGVVIGYAGMWKICDEGHITNIAVAPEYRRQSVGRAMLSVLLETAEKEEVTKLTLEVRKGNTAALALYEGFDFKVGGERKSYYADNGEDALIMWRIRE